MRTLEEILVSRGEVERVLRRQLSVTVWRALSIQGRRANPLHPDVVERELPSGRFRRPDVATYTSNGVLYVRAQVGRGTSVVGDPGVFGDEGWEYLRIPEGTIIPADLIITKDHFVERYGTRHYSICPNSDIPVSVYLRALDQLARNAGIRIVEERNAKH